MSALEFDLELQSLKERSIDRLLMADVFDLPAFERLLTHLDAKAATLRDGYVIPKQFLACLRDASASIISRAEYVAEARANKALAARFDLLLDLTIRGETLAGRTPGVPRVI